MRKVEVAIMATDGSDFNAYLASDYYFMLMAAFVLNPESCGSRPKAWVLSPEGRQVTTAPSPVHTHHALKGMQAMIFGFYRLCHIRPFSHFHFHFHSLHSASVTGVTFLCCFRRSFACYYYFTLLPRLGFICPFCFSYYFLCRSLPGSWRHSSIIHIDFFLSSISLPPLMLMLSQLVSRHRFVFPPMRHVNNWQETLPGESCILADRTSQGQSHWSPLCTNTGASEGNANLIQSSDSTDSLQLTFLGNIPNSQNSKGKGTNSWRDIKVDEYWRSEGVEQDRIKCIG